MKARMGVGATLLLAALACGGCERVLPQRTELTLPSEEEAQAVLAEHGITASVRVSGNVIELSVPQPPEQIARGGALWARVGPYIYLFSPATQQLFAHYRGVAAVRARTVVGPEEIASAQLGREGLREGEWRRARSLLAAALQEGTTRPSRLEELVRFGEQFTEYQYSPAYVPNTEPATR